MSPEPPREHSLRAKALGGIWSLLLRFQAATWHKTLVGQELFTQRIHSRQPTLGIFWHGKYIPLFALLRGCSAVIFSSRSRRGDVIAEICACFGHHCVQIADHGGDRALETMHQSLEGATLGAIAVDGPRGPYHAVKRGAIQLASQLGFDLLPISVAARRPRVSKTRWDHMEVPRLFDSVALGFAEPISVPPDLPNSEIPLWAARIQLSLERLDHDLETRVRPDG